MTGKDSNIKDGTKLIKGGKGLCRDRFEFRRFLFCFGMTAPDGFRSNRSRNRRFGPGTAFRGIVNIPGQECNDIVGNTGTVKVPRADASFVPFIGC